MPEFSSKVDARPFDWRPLWLALRTQLALTQKHPWGTLLVFAAIVIATAGLTAVKLINDGASQQWRESQPAWLSPTLWVEASDQDQPLTRADYASLRRAGFHELMALIRYTGNIYQQAGRVANPTLSLVALDTTAVPWHGGSSLPAPGLSGEIRLWTHPQTAQSLTGNLTLEDGSALPPLSATDAGIPPDTLFMDIAHFYAGSRTLSGYPLTALVATQPLSDSRRQLLEQALPDHLSLRTKDPQNDVGTLGDSFQLNLWAMGMLMLVVSLFIVVNALHLMLRSQLHTLVQLRQLGIPSRQLSLAIGAQMLWVCAIACLVGVSLGVHLTRLLSPGLTKTFANLFEIEFVLNTPQVWKLQITAWGLSAFAVSSVAWLPVRQLERQLNHQPMPCTTAAQRWLSRSALALLCLSALLLCLYANSQILALGSIALTLLAGTGLIIVTLPRLINAIARLVPAEWAIVHWTVASAAQLSSHTRLAVCAFFIALAANMGMNLMVDSFRHATESWLQQRLVAPFYLHTPFPLEATPPDGAELFPAYHLTARLNNSNLSLRSLPTRDEWRKSVSLTAGAPVDWDQFDQGEGILINQQLAFRQQLAPGDRVTLPLPDSTLTAKVLGVYRDYGNPDAQALLPAGRLAAFSDPVDRYALWLAAPSVLAPLQQWLAEVSPGAQLYSQAQLRELSMAEFDRTFTVTDGLNSVTLAVAGLSFLVSIALIGLQMRPQLSLLRALGVSGFQVRLALLGQYVLICVGTTLVALPFGGLLSWLLVNKVNRFAFDWAYPLQLNPAVILQSALISVGVILLLLCLPLLRLNARLDLRNEKTL